jgi:hypothetical protein
VCTVCVPSTHTVPRCVVVGCEQILGGGRLCAQCAYQVRMLCPGALWLVVSKYWVEGMLCAQCAYLVRILCPGVLWSVGWGQMCGGQETVCTVCVPGTHNVLMCVAVAYILRGAEGLFM